VYLYDTMRYQYTSTIHAQALSSFNPIFNDNTIFNRSQVVQYKDFSFSFTLINKPHVQRDLIVVVSFL
jgi:hypothetical protein